MKRYYSMREVCEMFGVTRTTIGRWENPKDKGYCYFPPRVFLGPVHSSKSMTAENGIKRSNCRVGYPIEEVDVWDQSRKDARDTSSQEGKLKLVSKTS
jgi:predicted DNA-binding transcriptional regulator AlpA